MNTEGLRRIIRAAAATLGENTVVIIGGQSILASYREFMLPDDTTMSAEADIVEHISPALDPSPTGLLVAEVQSDIE